MFAGLSVFPQFRLLATAFWVAWITIFYSGLITVAPATTGYDASAAVFSVSTVFLAATIIVLSFAVDEAWRIISDKRAVVALGVATGLCTIIIGFESLVPAPIFWLSAAFTGIGTGCLATRCAVMYAETEPLRATAIGCFGLILGVLIYALMDNSARFNGPGVMLVAAAFMPVACALVSLAPNDSVQIFKPDDVSKKLAPGFIRVVAFVTLMSFALASVRGYYPKLLDVNAFDSSRTDVAVSLIVLGAVIALAALSRPNGLGGRFFYVLFIASVCLILPVPFLGFSSAVSGTLASVASGSVMLLAWCFFAFWSYCTGMTPVRVFGLGFGGCAAGTALGFIFGDFICGIVPDDLQVLAGTLFVLGCLLVSVVFLNPRQLLEVLESSAMLEPEMQEAFEEEAAVVVEEEAGPKQGRFMLKCQAVAQAYGLSARETEVFVNLAMHKGVKQIAEELFISFNTARTHVRKIYSKLGVHSHQELDALLDGFDSGNPDK